MAEHVSAFGEQPVVAGGDAERAVRGGKHLVRHQGKTGAAKSLWRLAGVMVIIERPLHPRHRAVEQRRVDHAACAGLMPRLQRTERADHAPLRGRPVVDGGCTEGRRIVRPAGQRHHAAIGLQQRIEARRFAQRTLGSERPDRTIDQPRVQRAHHVGPDAQVADHAGTQVLDQDVGVGNQPLQLCDIVGILDVEGDGLLVAVHRVEQHRVAVDEERSPRPRVVAAIQLLDLDDFGAHVAEDHAGHRPRHRLPDFDHLDACKWSTHHVSPASVDRRIRTRVFSC